MRLTKITERTTGRIELYLESKSQSIDYHFNPKSALQIIQSNNPNHTFGRNQSKTQRKTNLDTKLREVTEREREKAYVDGELARERPIEGVVRGGAFASGAFGGLEEGGAQGHGGVDEMSLIGVAGSSGLEETVEGEVNGERGGRG